MAGHSKWANIRHRKAAQDSKRGKLFTRLIRELTVAARAGAEPDQNPRLRQALERAQAENMPRDTVNRAIARGSNQQSADNLEEISYEGYGPCGVAVFVNTLTDNRNRTVAAVRHAFTKTGGKLGTDGSVAYLFKRCGEIELERGGRNGDEILDIAADLDAEDVIDEPQGPLMVLTTVERLYETSTALSKGDLVVSRAKLSMIPETMVSLESEKHVQQLANLLDELDELDDVCDVYHNAECADELWPSEAAVANA